MMDKIKIDVAHRMSCIGSRPHQMMVKLESLDSKINVMGYAKNLRSQTVTIRDHLPKAIQERHSAQLFQLKQEKINNPCIKCTLIRDKLIVSNIKSLTLNLKETHRLLGLVFSASVTNLTHCQCNKALQST